MRTSYIGIFGIIFLATACAGPGQPIGGDCELGCGDDTACLPVAPFTAVCTVDCSADATACPENSVCIDAPEPGSYCLALCDGDGSCADGDPGFPLRDAEGNPDLDTCVCIPWSRS